MGIQADIVTRLENVKVLVNHIQEVSHLNQIENNSQKIFKQLQLHMVQRHLGI